MRIGLDGDSWQLKGFLGDAWRWEQLDAIPDAPPLAGWIPASVPGSIHHDLSRAGAIPDPYRDRNTLAAEWVPERWWIERRAFRVGPELRGSRIRLVFEGLDFAARIHLNGDEIGRHASMFAPAIFDVAERLRYGRDNVVAVVLEPAPPSEPQVGETARVRVHKSRMTYGWDFCPRMVHLGIWGSVWLEVTGPAAIEDVWVRTRLEGERGDRGAGAGTDDDGGAALVRIAVEASWPQVEASGEAPGLEAHVVIVDPGGHTVAEGRARARTSCPDARTRADTPSARALDPSTRIELDPVELRLATRSYGGRAGRGASRSTRRAWRCSRMVGSRIVGPSGSGSVPSVSWPTSARRRMRGPTRSRRTGAASSSAAGTGCHSMSITACRARHGSSGSWHSSVRPA